jgi:hypothetical protein
MGRIIFRDSRTSLRDIPQPFSIITGANLRPVQPPPPAEVPAQQKTTPTTGRGRGRGRTRRSRRR